MTQIAVFMAILWLAFIEAFYWNSCPFVAQKYRYVLRIFRNPNIGQMTIILKIYVLLKEKLILALGTFYSDSINLVEEYYFI